LPAFKSIFVTARKPQQPARVTLKADKLDSETEFGALGGGGTKAHGTGTLGGYPWLSTLYSVSQNYR